MGNASGAKVHDFVTVSGDACIFGDSSLRDNVIVEVTIGNHVIIKDRVVVKGYGYITNYIHIEGNLVVRIRLSFPCILKGKCEIKSNDDIIFITNGYGCRITKGKRTMYRITESIGHLLHRIEAMCFGNFIIKPGGLRATWAKLPGLLTMPW